MFRKLYNQALLTAELTPSGPILIKEGGASPDPAAPDLAFVRTWRSGTTTVYLPGSSLKGVLRAHAERILATDVGLAAAENPFDFLSSRRVAAGQAREAGDTAGTYRASCEADRLFGSTQLAGRLRIADAYPTAASSEQANHTEIRWSVGIKRDRGAGQNPFEQEAVTSGRFAFRATLENFELWMLALILQTLADLHDGFVQIGHSKSRGFGAVQVDVPSLELRWPGAAPNRIEGAGPRETDPDLRKRYGLAADDAIDVPDYASPAGAGLLSGVVVAGWEHLNELRQQLAPRWQVYVTTAKEEAQGAA